MVCGLCLLVILGEMFLGDMKGGHFYSWNMRNYKVKETEAANCHYYLPEEWGKLAPYSMAQQYHSKEAHCSKSCTSMVECFLGIRQALVSIPKVQVRVQSSVLPKHIHEMTRMFYFPLGNDFQFLVKLFTIQINP